jgi:hypothetical protein
VLNAVSKARHLGLIKPHEEKPKEAHERERGKRFSFEVMHRAPDRHYGSGGHAYE